MAVILFDPLKCFGKNVNPVVAGPLNVTKPGENATVTCIFSVLTGGACERL